MATAVPLSTLIARVRQRANIEGATAFVTDAEITDSLNASIEAEIYELLCQYVGENYARAPSPYTIFTVQNQTLYQAPANLRAVISVDVWLGGQYPVSAKRYYESQRNMLRAFPFGWNYTYPVYYQLQGTGASTFINFLSAPNAGYQVDVNYQQTFRPLVSTTDTFDDVDGWSEIAVLDTAAKCLIKAKQFDAAQFLDARKERMLAKIRASAPNRHAGEPEVMNIIANRPQYGDGYLE